MKRWSPLFLALALLIACGKDDQKNPFDPNAPKPKEPDARSASIGIVGDPADVQTTTKSGIVIMGGGADVAPAFRWMIERSGGGDAVIIRATGTDAYNSYVRGLATTANPINSVETLLINSVSLANNDGVAKIIRDAEMLFIAGGDQAHYTSYWKGTKVMEAINYLLTEKKVPVGGTSAGAAILGNYYFSAEQGGLTSTEAMANPYRQSVAIGRDDFLKSPFLQNVITDQHFSQREREGRMAVFLGRIMKDWDKAPYGIAVDEGTAVCIDETGMAEVVGSNKAFFLKTDAAKTPETFSSNTPATWNHDGKAIEASAISALYTGNKFNVTTFQPVSSTGWELSWWHLSSGAWVKTNR